MRAEYWYFVLFIFIVEVIAYLIDVTLIGQPVLYTIAAIAFLLPSLAVTVRRLHDTDRSGWWIFLSVIPLIGAIVLLVWFCTRGSVGGNRFG